MGSFDPNFFYIPDEEEIDNVFPVEEQETLRQSYSLGGGSRNNLGGAFSYVQSDPLTVSRSVLVPPPRLSVAALDPMNLSMYQKNVCGLQKLTIHQGITRFFLPYESDRHELDQSDPRIWSIIWYYGPPGASTGPSRDQRKGANLHGRWRHAAN